MRRIKKTRITDMNSDVLKVVMMLVAQSLGGAKSFIRATSVCKSLKEAAEDEGVLKSLDFQKIGLSGYPPSFWNTIGWLHKCARAGNVSACNKILDYIGERLLISQNMWINIQSAGQFYLEAKAAQDVVNTRARKRAVVVAMKVYNKTVIDFCKHNLETQNQIKAYKQYKLDSVVNLLCQQMKSLFL